MSPDLFLREPGAKACLFDGMSIVRFWVAFWKSSPATHSCMSMHGGWEAFLNVL